MFATFKVNGSFTLASKYSLKYIISQKYSSKDTCVIFDVQYLVTFYFSWLYVCFTVRQTIRMDVVKGSESILLLKCVGFKTLLNIISYIIVFYFFCGGPPDTPDLFAHPRCWLHTSSLDVKADPEPCLVWNLMRGFLR